MNQSNNKNNKSRFGSKLEHGKAHEEEHKSWSRRDFLYFTGLAAIGGGMMLNNIPVEAFGPSPLMGALSNAETDRSLVLLRFKGGSDGQNIVVPIGQYDLYSTFRPNIAIPNDTDNMIPLGEGAFGVPKLTMTPASELWDAGKMKIAHSVGYPNQNRSHFRSTDIWASASDYNEFINSGWIGRYLEQEYPAYFLAPPSFPAAIKIGTQNDMIFRGASNPLGLVFNNVDEFYQIAQTGQLYDTNNLPECLYGEELGFIREMSNNTFRYSQALKDAYDSSSTDVTYPDNDLADQLLIVSRLIKGRLGAKVYMVEIGGFDTHSNEINDLPILLDRFSTAVKAFYDDLGTEFENDVMTLTFTEFHRRIDENGSLGTDHGEAGPIMLFGGGLQGNGFIGQAPDLKSTEEGGDVRSGAYLEHHTDFRSIYATLLQDWLCIDPVIVDAVLMDNFSRVENMVDACSPGAGSNNQAVLLGHEPVKGENGAIHIKYAMLSAGTVRLHILDTAGQEIVSLQNGFQERGSYKALFRPSDHGLPSGEYVYQLDTGGKRMVRTALVVF